MQLSENIYSGGLIEEITRITGVSIDVYSNKARIVRLNNALDRYWFLASQSAPKGAFDDVNQAAIPLETQNIVEGDNEYKISDFTNEVLQILRISALDADALEMDLTREEFDDIRDFNEVYSTDSNRRGNPQWWTKMGDYIYIRPCPDYAEANGLRCYANRELSKFVFTTFTTTFASDLFNAVAHGLLANDAVIFETDGADLPSGVTEDTTVYYVIASGLTADVFKVSTTLSGSTITIADNGTGNHKFTKVSKIPGIPIIHHPYLAKLASLDFLVEKKLPQAGAIARMIAKDEQDILEYWSHRGRELKTIIRPRRRVFK